MTAITTLRLGALLLTSALLATTAHAEGEADPLDKLLDQSPPGSSLGGWADPLVERKRSYPYVEHHGYFRFRADFFHNGHLSTVIPGDDKSGTSGIPAPLTENAINDADGGGVGSEDAKVIATANIRFRYSPKLHVSESLRIGATFDILDNLVLGSTPDFAGNLARPDAPLSAFSTAQAPPSSGVNGFSDGIRVKEAYGEFHPSFLLRVGRQASHWGLGILANSGKEVDDDFGDYTDRALLVLQVAGIYIAAAWDYVYSGPIYDDPARAYGQPVDLGGADDTNQWVLSIFQRPLTEEDEAKRRVATYERFEPAFDWGVYGVLRMQEFDVDVASYEAWRDNGGVATYNELGLVPRKALAVIPDLWLRYEQRFDFVSGIKLEVEAAAIVGSVENVEDSPNGADSRDLMQWGVAFEGEYSYDTLVVGLDAGAASGDSANGFGILDRHTLADEDGTPNRELSAFKFDRDYKIDLIMFREVIGGITNAWYVKPYVSYDIFDTPEDTLGFRLDLLVAGALEAEATPGNDSFYGFEADVRAFYYKGAFKFDLEMGFLLPGGAFDYRPVDNANNRNAEFAFTLQSRLTMFF